MFPFALLLSPIIFGSVLIFSQKMPTLGPAYVGMLGLSALALLGISVATPHWPLLFLLLATALFSAALHQTGTLIYLQNWAATRLNHRPQRLVWAAPLLTYFLSWVTGTGNIVLFFQGLIISVAKQQRIAPRNSLVLATIASQMAVLASPLSAASNYLMTKLSGRVSPAYLCVLLTISSFIALLLLILVVTLCFPTKKLAQESSQNRDSTQENLLRDPGPSALLGCRTLGFVLVLVLFFSLAGHSQIFQTYLPALASMDGLLRTFFIFVIASIYLMRASQQDPIRLFSDQFMISGLSSMFSVFSMSVLGTSLMYYWKPFLAPLHGLAEQKGYWLPLLFFSGSCLLYSQAVTASTLFPLIDLDQTSLKLILISIPALNNLFFIPNYTTAITAFALDETKSTRPGKFFFDHSFFLPGVLSILLHSFILYVMLSCFSIIG